MLPKKERFSSKDLLETKKIKSTRLNSHIGNFVVYATPLPMHGKKGIIVTKKVFKKASERIECKRLFFNTILDIYKNNSDFRLKTFLFYPKKVFSREELLDELLKFVL